MNPHALIEALDPIGQNIIIQLSESISRGVVVVAATYVDATSTCKVIKKSSKIKHLREGEIVLVPSSFGERKINQFGPYVVCDAKEAFAKVINGKIYPIGNRLLVKRLVDEEELESGLIIPACTKSKDQGLDCIIVQPGILKAGDRWKVGGYEVGEKVRLTKWSENMIEILYKGEYHLVINENELLCTL